MRSDPCFWLADAKTSSLERKEGCAKYKLVPTNKVPQPLRDHRDSVTANEGLGFFPTQLDQLWHFMCKPAACLEKIDALLHVEP